MDVFVIEEEGKVIGTITARWVRIIGMHLWW